MFMVAKNYLFVNFYFCKQYTKKCYRKFHLSFGRYINMSTENLCKGAPLSMLYGSALPWDNAKYPPVQPGHNHAVLYHIPSNGVLADDRPPKPQIGQDKWDQHHVRLPCSRQSLYPVTDENGDTRLKKRWLIIENTLRRPIRNSKQLADAILSYNTKFKNRWKFRALHKLFNECLEEEESEYFFEVTLPEIIKLVLDLPKLIQAPIPLLKQHKNSSVSLSQQQISSLLANAFFCTFPRRNSLKSDSEYASYPFINFNTLYETSGSSDVIEKLKCLCHYFRRVCIEVPVGVVTFSRRSVAPRRLPDWEESSRPTAGLPLHIDPTGTIEDADGLIQVDFANKYLGGGVLGHGCVQEEIRFVICPELMASMIFTEVLRPNETVMIIGAERYSRYIGYGYTFEWAGTYVDTTPRDCGGRRRVAVLAMDALLYAGGREEFKPESITRELKKAWVGFSFYIDEESDSVNFPGIATGNWGCGAFGGTPQLKSLIQIMACAQARRPMAYYTFGDKKLGDEIIDMYCLLDKYNVTVGQLYKLLMEFCETNLPRARLHSYITQKLIGVSPTNTLATDFTENDLMERGLLSDSMDTECFISQNTFCSEFSPEKSTLEQEDPNKNINGEQKADKMDDNGQQTNNTSRLFQEMERLDQGNGSLNLNRSHPSTFSYNANTSSHSKAVMDVKIPMDISTDVKKKISKKITDYFAKSS
ncbi:poly(ADP-ribose) glycohydrolase-like [Battus philenor]|uniref:poly(ADP-ribose) glycohydrolase-like n=1 Tax=Battus philenor TaxID=42288 RepID=UPI0035CF1F1E